MEDDQYLGTSPITYDACGCVLIFVGISLRELIHEYKHQTLVLFKCCLLQPKVNLYLRSIRARTSDTARCFSLAPDASDYAWSNSL